MSRSTTTIYKHCLDCNKQTSWSPQRGCHRCANIRVRGELERRTREVESDALTEEEQDRAGMLRHDSVHMVPLSSPLRLEQCPEDPDHDIDVYLAKRRAESRPLRHGLGKVANADAPKEPILSRTELADDLERLARQLREGCSSSSCKYRDKSKGGQHTNGGCQCRPQLIQRELEGLARVVGAHRFKWKGE